VWVKEPPGPHLFSVSEEEGDHAAADAFSIIPESALAFFGGAVQKAYELVVAVGLKYKPVQVLNRRAAFPEEADEAPKSQPRSQACCEKTEINDELAENVVALRESED